MSYYYGYDSFLPAFDAALSVLTAVWVVAALVGIVCYVFHALALMRLAQRRGIAHAWLAWIPVADSYLFGKVAEVCAKTTGEKKVMRFSRILLIFSCIIGGSCILFYCLFAIGIAAQSVLALFFILPFYLVLIVALLVYYVFYYTALYSVYRDCIPDNTPPDTGTQHLLFHHSALCSVCLPQ